MGDHQGVVAWNQTSRTEPRSDHHRLCATAFRSRRREEALLRSFKNQRRVKRPNQDRKSTRLNSSHVRISYAVFCLKKKKIEHTISTDHRSNFYVCDDKTAAIDHR